MNEQIACEVAYETGWINGYNNALEEFTEKLKSNSTYLAIFSDSIITISEINNISKEMIKE